MFKLIGSKGDEYHIIDYLKNVPNKNMFYSVEHNGNVYVAKCAVEDENSCVGKHDMGVSNEIRVLKFIDESGGHPNIVKLIDEGNYYYKPIEEYEYRTNEECVFFIMPYMGPSLDKWAGIDKPEDNPLKILSLYKIANGIEIIHKNGYVHRDVKLKNMLLKGQVSLLDMEPENCDSVLIDFELSHKPGIDKIKDGKMVGTFEYFPPELIPSYVSFKSPKPGLIMGCVSFESDIYSFGASMLHLIMGKKFQDLVDKYPFEIQKIEIPDLGKKVPRPLKKLVKNCMVPEPKERPRIDEVKKNLKMILENRYDLSPDV